jgi:hypothetical protein
MSKRKLPDSIVDVVVAAAAGNTSSPASIDLVTTPPRRCIPKGSPAEAFLQRSPTGEVTVCSQNSARIALFMFNHQQQVCELTCDLRALPKDSWAKRRTLSAVVLAVFPVTSKLTTIRRNVLLRDEHGECVVCVWGNHTTMLNESSVGRAVTFHRVNVQDFEGTLQLGTPKDSSIALGNTPRTLEILEWIHENGNACKTVQAAMELTQPSVLGIHGILARVSTETITMKDGRISKLTSITLSAGPPQVEVTINFWNAPPARVATWDDMVHHAINITMVRCNVKATGNCYDCIGDHSRLALCGNDLLEKWWFDPKTCA